MVGLGNIDDVYKHYLVVIEENQQLKELLKRCRDFINYEVPDHCIDDILLDKITNAIEEKK